MVLSALQKSILKECYLSGRTKVPRQLFNKYYAKRANARTAVDHITVSLERLIDRGLMIGFGRRTPEKWFISEVKLTPLGRRMARTTLGKQQQLPLN